MDFKNTLIIMTSNVGSSVIEKGGATLGFHLDMNEEDSSYNRIKTLVNEELKQYFRYLTLAPLLGYAGCSDARNQPGQEHIQAR